MKTKQELLSMLFARLAELQDGRIKTTTPQRKNFASNWLYCMPFWVMISPRNIGVRLRKLCNDFLVEEQHKIQLGDE